MARRAAALLLFPVLVSGAGLAAAGQRRSQPAVQDHLNRTADAILALKSARFTLNREGAPAVLDEKSGVTFTTADCSYAAPDRVSCNVKVALKNGTIVQLTRVWVPEGAFQSNPLTRQFARLPADAGFNGVVLFAKTGIPDILRGAVQRPQLVGPEKALNRDTIHLKGEVSGARLSPLIGVTLDAAATYRVDMWIDEASAAPVRLHVSESASAGWLIDIIETNGTIDIPTPQVPPPPSRP